jgi:hypothetical protein
MPATANNVAHNVSAGCVRRYWVRTTTSLSTSTLVLGVAAAHAIHRNILVAGVAALVAGAMSMAAGEYVSVHSQAENRSGQSFI